MQFSFENIKRVTEGIYPELVKMRRHLHSHPELGREEFQTSEYLKQKIREVGSLKLSEVGSTGFCADLITNKKKPWLALRADIDALPIPDTKNVEYKSKNKNKSHACGHDFHATVVYGVAHVLNDLKENLSGNVRFIFQHAEELTPGGAIDFVKAGKLDNIKTVFGLHADAALKVNTVGILPGWISAQSIRIQIELEGSGGHSARPYEAFDPVYAGTIMLNELYSGLYRKQKAELPFVFSIGKINAGNAFNAIATSYIAEGTLRVTDTEQGDKLVEYIEKTVASIADKWGGTAKVNSIKGAPPVINDPEATRKVRNLIKDVLRDEQIITPQKSMGGEDFSMFLSKAPGVFLKIGISNDTINAPVHTGRFDIDEKAISFAVNLYAWILMRFFN